MEEKLREALQKIFDKLIHQKKEEVNKIDNVNFDFQQIFILLIKIYIEGNKRMQGNYGKSKI